MKYSAVIVAALAAVASAQDISIFPECSLPCILDAISKATSCQATDYACVCKNMDALTAAATGCVVEKCGFEVATGQVLPATKEFCANVPAAGGSSSAAPVETTSSAAPTEAAPTTTEDSSPSAAPTTVTDVSTSAPAVVTTTTSTSSAHSNATMTRTTPTPSSVVTAGAATFGSIGAAAMLMVAAFAL
ncbi:hypothetical protein GE09DRAFT_1053496 [Coniochaeta sp. 2T2.1]|nr:hypothetical protein GE09DRAFT_1053496 [Coniochaeta sp. 2T2.1]